MKSMPLSIRLDKRAVPRLTNLAPWPRGALAKAYKRAADSAWEKTEAAATAVQRPPSWKD